VKAEGRKQKAEVVARFLEYPNPDRGGHAAALSEEIAAFLDEIRNVSPDGLEELYTRTFDLNPVASLDLGWHLYGERYERGRLMAVLRELENEAGVDSGSELPDHLTVVLRLIAVADLGEPLRQQLAVAVRKIRETLDEQGNPYRHLVRAAEEMLAPGSPRPAERRVMGDALEGVHP